LLITTTRGFHAVLALIIHRGSWLPRSHPRQDRLPAARRPDRLAPANRPDL